jgi:hypothetical protein
MPTPYKCYHQPYLNYHAFVNDERVRKQDLAKQRKSVSNRSIGKISPNAGTPAVVTTRQCVSDREMDAILDEEFSAQHSKNRNALLPVAFSAEEKTLTSTSFKGFPSENEITSLALPQAAPVAATQWQDHDVRGFYSNTMTASPMNAHSKFSTDSDTFANSKKENCERNKVVSTTSTLFDSTSRERDIFSERLEMLKEFKNTHGHIIVPSRVTKYNLLYRWCSGLKKGYAQWKAGERNRHGINYAQVKQLEAIGFKLDTKRPLVTRNTFEEKLKKLREFREKYGHTNVSTHHHLYWWCYRIRIAYKLWVKGDINAEGLTDEKVKRLEELGFEWNPSVRCKKEYMERKFQELLDFKQNHGHFNVPHSQKNSRSLYVWCCQMRADYRESTVNNVPLPGLFGLTEEYVDRLREIGFHFDAL